MALTVDDFRSQFSPSRDLHSRREAWVSSTRTWTCRMRRRRPVLRPVSNFHLHHSLTLFVYQSSGFNDVSWCFSQSLYLTTFTKKSFWSHTYSDILFEIFPYYNYPTFNEYSSSPFHFTISGAMNPSVPPNPFRSPDGCPTMQLFNHQDQI